MSRIDANGLAVDYLLASRVGGPDAERLEQRLADSDETELRASLPDDDARIAFWLDVYNAAVVRAGTVDLTDQRVRWSHFRRRSVVIAGQRLSLDGIENGLLRRSRWKLSLGYLGNPLPARFERTHRVARLDPRIHFALNCGASSCPPIAAYHRERLDEELELATRSYLQDAVRRDGEVVRVSPLFLWYIADFGGPRGLRAFLDAAGVEVGQLPLRLSTYDWTPAPERWASDTDEGHRPRAGRPAEDDPVAAPKA